MSHTIFASFARDMNGARIEVGDRVVAWAWDALPGRIQAIKRGGDLVVKFPYCLYEVGIKSHNVRKSLLERDKNP